MTDAMNEHPDKSTERTEAWLFARDILGRDSEPQYSKSVGVSPSREQLEWLAAISPRHAEELTRLRSAEAAARHDRELLQWAAQISSHAEDKRRALEREEAAGRDPRGSMGEINAIGNVIGNTDTNSWLDEWNEFDHPRDDKGRFTSKGGSSGGGSLTGGNKTTGLSEPIPANPSNPSHWYLPSDAKGEWLGDKGESTFRLKTPVDVNGKLIREIEFTGGIPILDKFALPGNTATIVLTGDHPTDLRHAEEAWRNLNPGKKLPENAHHDLLHATEQTVVIDGKKTKVIVGKMHLIPTEANEAVFHQGSANIAKKYYQANGVDAKAVARVAKEEARLAGKSGTIVSRALRKITPGKVTKGLAPLVGRSIARAIPIVGSGLAVLEFADNAEAHGVGGAILRATPVLSDLISAVDVGSDLARETRDEADAAAGAALQQMNEPSRKAWELADEQTIAAYDELAPEIRVTNPPQSHEGAGLVDPDEITAALHAYREAMQNANFKRNVGIKRFDFEAAADHNKRQLRQRLERAGQKRSPKPRGPIG